MLGEHGKGGFLGNFARAFFSQDSDGTFYIAVGAGVELRSGLGLYTLSVRADDHADDHNTNPDIMLLPGQSITACIDSDVRPGDPGLRPWHWWGTKRESQPVYGLESIDDLDVFSFRIFDEGSYVLFVRTRHIRGADRDPLSKRWQHRPLHRLFELPSGRRNT